MFSACGRNGWYEAEANHQEPYALPINVLGTNWNALCIFTLEATFFMLSVKHSRVASS